MRQYALGMLFLWFRVKCRDRNHFFFLSSFVVPCPVINSQHLRLYMNGSICFERTVKQTSDYNKGWKFLKKLWCCIGGGNKVVWLYQLPVSWKCKLATVTLDIVTVANLHLELQDYKSCYTSKPVFIVFLFFVNLFYGTCEDLGLVQFFWLLLV